MDNHDAAIQFIDVNYSVEDTSILKNLTGIFPKAKITTIVGPSGAGKSTLFRLCNCLRSPNSGEIYINGKRISDYDPITLRKMIGLALQNAPMISGTVWNNLELPLKLQGKQLIEEEAKRLLLLVGLEEKFLFHKVGDLSGGQRQKVSIARTLVNRPKVLLLDEITSSLDRVSQHEIEELIVKINKEFSTTVIWITHNLQQAINVSDYTWVLMNGELVEAGDASILTSPTNERVQQFVKGESF
ncbi:phosphate ABC transporter ATP-binding protein [Caldibacillus lycopersici]|uniref:Phosphate ABC transporter ATP-binding protein n=1 Tax=Perspicuibacillus lycopersici TaxID=1325689 RepID=A0AAE3LPJ7_9BACI|nr:phosphate ABC transporter ATP-binding protein [Perspicuibacillus lycopersici]MCU9615041.1 phosphate ABC transporter ATP-binding protein [Perspicuibacillus lycopersici]